MLCQPHNDTLFCSVLWRCLFSAVGVWLLALLLLFSLWYSVRIQETALSMVGECSMTAVQSILPCFLLRQCFPQPWTSFLPAPAPSARTIVVHHRSHIALRPFAVPDLCWQELTHLTRPLSLWRMEVKAPMWPGRSLLTGSETPPGR